MEEDCIRISFVITHYNRPADLLKCITAIHKLNVQNAEIIVCDDGSERQHLDQIQNYPIDKLLVAQTNQGLAANINKGLAACKGEFIVYCQEDFILIPTLMEVLQECVALLDQKKLDMIRFSSNVSFNKVLPITDSISLIPKFSFHNFLQNYYQYSDHPFITTKSFYQKNGLYLEDTSGRYGETEYAIRILKSKARIGITKQRFAVPVHGSESVLANESGFGTKNYAINKKWIKIARAFRLYFELILYSKSKRGLHTYRNFRK